MKTMNKPTKPSLLEKLRKHEHASRLSEFRDPLRDVKPLVIFFYLFTFFSVIVVIVHHWTDVPVATAVLWSCACMTVGASVGFLFGVPRIVQRPLVNSHQESSNDEYRQQVNTNLTDISDWLTKIIVGVGLVELRNIPSFLRDVSTPLARHLNPEKPLLASAAAITVCFFMIGFLFGYLFTRLFLAGAFSRADQGAIQAKIEASEIKDSLELVIETAREHVNYVLSPPADPKVLSPTSRGRAVLSLAATAAEKIRPEDRTWLDWYTLGVGAWANGDHEGAEESTLQALHVGSSTEHQWKIENFLGLVMTYRNGGSSDGNAAWIPKVEKLFKDSLKKCPSSYQAVILTNQALFSIGAGQFHEAERLSEAALKAPVGPAQAFTADHAYAVLTIALLLQSKSSEASKQLNLMESNEFFFLILKEPTWGWLLQRLKQLSDLPHPLQDVLRSLSIT